MHASGRPLPWQITGKDAEGHPRRDHAHAYFSPFSTRPDRLLDCVVVWTGAGLDRSTWDVLRRLSNARIWFSGRPELRLELLGRHELDLQGFQGPSRCWRSSTPFVPPRFTKRRRGMVIDSPEDQLAWLCRLVLGREPAEIRPNALPDTGHVQLRTNRDRRAPVRFARGWRLRFDIPISGPIALGLNAHYGLGQFTVDPES